MELTIENTGQIGNGNFPDVIQFYDTTAELFTVNSGVLNGIPILKLNGDYSSPEFEDLVDVSPDTNISNFELKTVNGFGAVGSYLSDITHKLLIYEFQHDISDYLSSGSIAYSTDNPVSRMTLALENPDIKDPERPGNIAINEETSLLSPGAKVLFAYGAGIDPGEYEMGQFFIDRSNFTLASITANVDGRNTLGKVLGDQTVDEQNEYWLATVSENIKKLLSNANLTSDQYLVQSTTEQGWFTFTPNTQFTKALDTMLEMLPQWRVRELADGTIVIGDPSYAAFDQNGVYTFYRDKDIFSRQITRDDAQAYSRVCVHTENYTNVVFKDVVAYSGWNLKANKTRYVQVANGLQLSDLQGYADELAERLSDSGKVESFEGPFRPHLQCDDEVIIISANGSKSLGLITEITHRFGKQGFYTDFTVDSGGTVGKGRLSDYINKIASGKSGQGAELGSNDINMTEYINLARRGTVTTSSMGFRYRPKTNMIDGDNSFWSWDEMSRYQIYYRTDSYWEADRLDPLPVIEVKLAQRCLVNKIRLYFGAKYDEIDPTIVNLPKGYKVQYWNNSFWVDIATVVADGSGYIPNPEPVHEFDAVETSSIRLVVTPEEAEPGVYYSGHIREIEVWGNM